jgi:uncharacterized membrane protein YhaH (DUF805 family)
LPLRSGQTLDLGNLLFKFSGRIGRGEFWLAWLAYAIVYLVLNIVGALSDSMTLAALSSMITIVTFISSIAVGIKRLHDRDKSGWYVLLLYVAPTVLFLIGLMIGTTRDGATTLAYGLWLIALAISIWGFVELGCRRGTVGGNPYGPDPVAPRPATH